MHIQRCACCGRPSVNLTRWIMDEDYYCEDCMGVCEGCWMEVPLFALTCIDDEYYCECCLSGTWDKFWFLAFR